MGWVGNRFVSEQDDKDESKPKQDLPSWNRSRSKTKRKRSEEAPTQDAFVRGGQKAVSSRWVVIGSIVAVLGASVGGTLWWQARNTKKSEGTRAVAALAAINSRGVEADREEIMGDLDRPPPIPIFKDKDEKQAQLDEALAQLEATKPSDATKLADLIIAREALVAGEFDRALEVYDRFLGAHPLDHPLRFLAMEGKGFAHEESGRLEEALAAFEEMAPKGALFYRDMSLWHQGRMLEALERPDEASEIYKVYVEEFPLDKHSLAQVQVKDRLAELDPAVLKAAEDAAAAAAAAQAQPGAGATAP